LPAALRRNRCAEAIAVRSWAMIEPVSAYGATDSIWVSTASYSASS
jgi:hypothetical protein